MVRWVDIMTYFSQMSDFNVCFQIKQYHLKRRLISEFYYTADTKLRYLSVKFAHTVSYILH